MHKTKTHHNAKDIFKSKTHNNETAQFKRPYETIERYLVGFALGAAKLTSEVVAKFY